MTTQTTQQNDKNNLTDAQENAYVEFLMNEKNAMMDLDMTLPFYDQFRYLLDSDQRDDAFKLQRAVMGKQASKVKTSPVTPTNIDIVVNMIPTIKDVISICALQPLEVIRASTNSSKVNQTKKRKASNENQMGFCF